MSTTRNDWVPPPGKFIREELEARSWSQRDLAYILGIPEQAVNVILSGKRSITSEMAKALGNAFDVPAELFSNLQKAYDLAHAREPDPGIAKRARIQSEYPIREMIKRGWLQDTDAAMLEAQVARFFEVDNIDKVPHIAHAAKKTDYESLPPEQLAWLFRVRQIAKSVDAPKYSEKSLKEAVTKLKQLLVDPEAIKEVPEILSGCGVRFVVVESLPCSKIDGVCFWIDNNSPVIGMSLRHDRIDNFWFVLRHEIEHVLQKHGMKKPIVDVDLCPASVAENTDTSRPEEEKVADAAAADFCVSQNEMASFVARKAPYFSERDMLGFSRIMQVHPGLVAGQIQFRTGRYDLFKKYQVKIRSFVTQSPIVDGWGSTFPVNL